MHRGASFEEEVNTTRFGGERDTTHQSCSLEF